MRTVTLVAIEAAAFIVSVTLFLLLTRRHRRFKGVGGQLVLTGLLFLISIPIGVSIWDGVKHISGFGELGTRLTMHTISILFAGLVALVVLRKK